MMDLVVHAPQRPERGETVLGTSFNTFLGGKGFNQAVAAARAGASTDMVGRVGDDAFGRQFLTALDREGIGAANVQVDPDAGTGVGMPLVEPSGENSIVVVPQANHKMTVADVRAGAEVIESAVVLLVQLELPHEVVLEAARLAHRAGALVVVNPAPAVHDLTAFTGLIDYLVPNQAEAARLSGEPAGAAVAARALQRTTGARGVVLTLGSAGVAVFEAEDGAAEFIERHAVVCIDSVGAGDAFCGTMAACLARGATLLEAARYGNAAGALAVTRHGAEPSMPRQAEVERLLGGSYASGAS
jgi:ribokinase